MQAYTLEQQIMKKDQIYYKELINQNIMIPHYTLTGSGCREIATLMKYPIYRICTCFGLISLQTNDIFSFMITASHNPGTDNGIKIGYANGKIISKKMFTDIEQCINSQEKFRGFVSGKLKIIDKNNQGQYHTFVGRDCRSSSPYLTEVVRSALNLLKIKVIDLGICSTPQLFSFSQYILKKKQINNIEEQNKLQKYKQIFVDEVMDQFQLVYHKLSSFQQETQQKISILLDFSNGSGAVSYLRYKERMRKHFHIQQIGNKQFNIPNEKCGAQFYTKNWNIAQYGLQFKQFAECFFFDGDSDRVICKTENCQKPFDGNYFLVFYVHVLKKIVEELKMKLKIDCKLFEAFRLNAIGTSFTNLGVKLCLKKIDINLGISQVGTLNLFRSATQLMGITVFFEPNGHGGVYFSEQTVKLIHQVKQEYPNELQLVFLDAMYNILKNNSRGYGLHNMLAFFLCKKYLNNSTLSNLIIFAEEDKKSLFLKPEFDKLFKNGVQRNNQLSQPNQIVLLIEQMRKRYEDYQITTRKSETQKYLVRIITQGLSMNTCKEINRQIQESLNNFGYLSQTLNDH